MKTIGDVIRKHRIKKGYTQLTLAKGICCEKYISMLENNQRSPSAYAVYRLSRKLGIEFLLELYGDDVHWVDRATRHNRK